MAEIRIGTSGWRYAGWRGDLPSRRQHWRSDMMRGSTVAALPRWANAACDTPSRCGYGQRALARWAEHIRLWSTGGEPEDAPRAPRRAARRDVYVYFHNDAKVRAPYGALALARLLGVTAEDGRAELPAGAALLRAGSR